MEINKEHLFDVTVIVPVYNVEKYVHKCLNSLNNQTLDNLEVLFINDGSTDNSKSIIEQFIRENKLNKKFRILSKDNGGLSDARNFGIEYARGKYICFLDSDDYVEPNCYELLFNYAERNNYLVVESGYYLTQENKNKAVKINDFMDKRSFAAYGKVVAWNKIYKKEIFKDDTLRFIKGLYYEDINFFYKLLGKIDYDKIGHLDVPLFHYIQRKDSISKQSTNKVLDILKVYDDLIANVSGLNDEIEYRCIRNLCCSFRRKAKSIQNKVLKKEIIHKFNDYIYTKFPNWKNNKYLSTLSATNIYLRLFLMFNQKGKKHASTNI